MSDSASEKSKQPFSDQQIQQIRILKALSRVESPASKQYQIQEIAQLAGFKDEKEAQRCLYIL